jgi:hypothetical protein
MDLEKKKEERLKRAAEQKELTLKKIRVISLPLFSYCI